MGRPRYQEGQLLRAGADLNQAGVTEYMFDIIYISWFVLVLSVVTNLAWFLYLSVPAYAVYKGLSLYRSVRN